MSDSAKAVAEFASKSNALDSYAIQYERVIASYVDPNATIHVVPVTVITKYKKGNRAMWEAVDWMNQTSRVYRLGSEYYYCSLNLTWSCSQTSPSEMQEFLGYNVKSPAESLERQISEGAILLGEVKEERVLNRTNKCLAFEIHPEKFSDEDWNEYVLGSLTGKDDSGRFTNLKAWECMDEETGLKTELVLNYRGEVDGEVRTIELNIRATWIEPNPDLRDSVFELPG